MRKILGIILFLFLINFSFAQIQVDFYADSNYVCLGFPVHFVDSTHSDTTIVSWFWDFGDSSTSTIQNPTHNYNTAGSYTVKLVVTDATSVDSLIRQSYVTVVDTPTANFMVSGDSLYPSFFYVFVADSMPNYHFSWNFGEETMTDTSAVMYHIFQSKGSKPMYLVVDNNAAGQCVDTAFSTIMVSDSIKVPNVFTPNGDGINDDFEIKTNGVNTYRFQVFNRWGAIVYMFIGKRIYWDGRSSAGVVLESGTYFFVLTSEDGTGYSKNGFIFLVN